MRLLFLNFLLWLALVSCSPPLSSASNPHGANGFVTGRSYQLQGPVVLAQRGRVTMLAPSEDPGDANVLATVPKGTKVRVQRVATYDPGTHAASEYPVGEIIDGPLKGQRVRMARGGLRGRFEALPDD